jgi:RNA polymerase sigma-70 factor (ECF subfamily)
MPDSRTDAELVEAARTDPAAFDALYRRHVPGVFRYVRSRVGSVDVAEDLTSSVFADVLSGLPKYRERGRFGAWLFTIARRRIQDLYRSEARRHAAHDSVTEADGGLGVEELQVLRSAMGSLTEDRREALELRFFGGLAVREVAEVMGRGESATKMLIHRGLAQLRQVLGDGNDA